MSIKRTALIILASTFLLGLFSVNSHAEEQNFYAGIRAATVSVDEKEIDELKNSDVDIKNASKGSLIIGYVVNPTVSFEAEIGTSSHEISGGVFDAINVDLDIGTFGLYGVYRSEGQYYFKGRGGLISRSTEFSPDTLNAGKDSAGLLAIGLGGGMRFNQVLLEAEWTSIESGIGAFGFNAIYNFK